MDKTTEVTGELMDWLKTSAEKGGDFLAEQAPMYAQEVVAWEFWGGLIGAIGFAVMSIVFVRSGVWLFSAGGKIRKADKYDPADIPCWMIGGLTFMVSIGCLFGSLCSMERVTKSLIAPRMVIIEHVRGLAK